MIDRAYCRTMARYNFWQNRTLWDVLQEVGDADALADRSLPQGSVLGTLNYLLWLDQMWLSRLFNLKAPQVAHDGAAGLTPTLPAWWAERFRADGALRMWADTLSSVDLHGDVAFWSITSGSDVIVSRGIAVQHMFTQQVELRARVRQVLAEMGHDLPPAALFLMPQG